METVLIQGFFFSIFALNIANLGLSIFGVAAAFVGFWLILEGPEWVANRATCFLY